MSISRRTFMRTGTMVGLWAAAMPLGGVVAFGQQGGKGSPSPGPSADALSRLTQADFTKALNTLFGIRLSSQVVWKVDLYEVEENKAGLIQGLDNFTLRFRGTHPSALGQNTYKFEHATLGKFNLFITPAGQSGGKKLYAAVFNRLQA